MMRIKFLVCVSGPAFFARPKDIKDVETAEALRFIDAGYAVPVENSPEVTAVKPTEQASPRRKR
jgi:hypothetical protein